MIQYTKIIKHFITKCDQCGNRIKTHKHYIIITYNAPYNNNAMIIDKKEFDLCDKCYDIFKELWDQNKAENYIKTKHYGIVDVRHIKSRVKNQTTVIY